MAVVKWLAKVLEVMLVAFLAIQTFLMGAAVVARYLFNAPIIWSDEIIRYSLVWMTFAGAALATREKQHIEVDVIDSVLPVQGKKIVNALVDVVVVAFMLLFAYYGYKMTLYQTGTFGETVVWMNQAYVYASIPIGSVALIIFTIAKYFGDSAPAGEPTADELLAGEGKSPC